MSITLPLALVAAVFTADPAPTPRPASGTSSTEVMLLAMYHFANPGLDRFNTEVDDYYSEYRQDEIVEVVELLETFEPHKVFVENRPSGQSILDEQYRAYVAGDKELSDFSRGRSETYQIGFRLARALGHPRVHCVDAQGLWLGGPVEEIATREKMAIYAEYLESMGQMMKEDGERMAGQSVRENLVDMNRPAAILGNHDYYNRISPLVVDPSRERGVPYLNQKVEGEEFMLTGIDPHLIGAELTAEWYKRNIRIYANILRTVESADERILVIFGQGHIRILQHLFEDHPRFQTVSANDYLE